MRSSRRNQGLNPEFAPSPTPSNSDGSDFLQDFQVETTLEEEEREEREALEKLQSSDKNENSDDNYNSSTIEERQTKDVVMSSESSDEDQSEDIVMVEVEEESKLKRSS